VVQRNVRKYVAAQREYTDGLNKALQGRLASERGMIFNAADTATFRARLGRAFYGRWRDRFGATAWSLLESEVGRLG
jgi:hypothetical protein